ncbi:MULTISPECIES: ScbR family autoregulator-binding transcription factor [Streptomyces]|uniref:TetR family transcriptional regulator n=1 Tax=Streptomyces atratus TaxID=1893 RepID=A0A2Z5JB76_STRAR|nr:MULTISPECIES: ScbR family autoregulator-binding transcription factor [Streptomyces]AXE77636.1 TetR family transcriptional regulator [Streptomyces atratus]MEE1807897.1 ScbR family autoregulator-binding transcription factor [Streptomyces sp. BE133]WPW28548.1 ScbR family autoregulator-binding transcription factor [Streptomyces atratus]GGT30041.1 gamma-butyrolactone-binding protein [Streptomyces atratus]
MAQQARAIQTRRSILVAAAAVFDERGYSSATISEILARAGVTKGALYFHFTSKEDLALGVMDVQLDSDPLPAQLTKLQELVDQGMLLAHRLRHEPLVRASVGLAMDQAVEGLDRGTPFRAWIDRLEHLLTAAKNQGELLPHVNARETAEMLAGSFSGIQVMSQALCKREDLGRRISVLLHYVLPSISTPAVLATLDMAEDRGERLFGTLGSVPSQAGAPD